MDAQIHPRVLELVASRICHDLVSPVGAVNNGVELMQELGEDAGAEAVKLISDSAANASIRLKAFRLSYGAAGTDKNVGFKEIREAFTDLLKSGRVTAEFESDLGVKFSMPPRGFFKVLLNLLVLAEECNHGEGKISVAAVEGNKGMTVTVTGKNPSFRDGAETALRCETAVDDLDPRSVHPYITAKFAEVFGLKIDWKADPDHGRLDFTLSF